MVVVADHAGYLDEPAGGIGVTVFFVLSGFLITRVIVEACDSGSWSMPDFVANRFVRLFPALLLMVAVVSVILAERGVSTDRIADRAVPALAYVQNMEPPRRFPVFGQTWSLGVEEQFYLVWPFALTWLLGPLPRRWWLVPAGALGLVVSIKVAPSFHQIYVYGPLVAVPAAVLLVAGAAGGNRLLELSPLQFAGRISYAVYLWHVPMLRLSGTSYDREAAIPALVIAVVVAVVSTLVVEEPLRRAWRLRRSQRRHQARPADLTPEQAAPRAGYSHT